MNEEVVSTVHYPNLDLYRWLVLWLSITVNQIVREDSKLLFDIKYWGTRYLYEATRERKLRFFWLASSISAAVGVRPRVPRIVASDICTRRTST